MTDVREDPHAWPALWAMAAGFFMLMVDATIVSVSIPAIMRAFGTDVASVIWVSSSYLLTYAVPLLITGRLGDRYGIKRVYLLGLAIFTASSLWCGLSTTITSLIIARAVQGLGASLMAPQTMAAVTRLFPPQRRGGPMAVWGAVASVAGLIGPVLGGLLVDSAGWEWIFFVNVPIGLLTMVAVWRMVPRMDTHQHAFDWLGVALNAVAIFCLVFALQEGQAKGWPLWVWGLMALGLVLLTVFIAWQWRNHREPLMPLELFANRNFTVANLAIFLQGTIIVAMSFPVMLFLQTVRGLSPTQAALLSLPTAVVSLAFAPFIGRRLNTTPSTRGYVVAGFALSALALLLQLWLIRSGLSVLWLLAPAAVMGLASTFIWGPLSVSATRDLPRHMSGAGSGVYNATRQLGSVLGSAAIATIISWQLSQHLGSHGGAPAGEGHASGRLPDAIQQPFSEAMSTSMWLPALLAIAGALVALLLRPSAAIQDAPAGD